MTTDILLPQQPLAQQQQQQQGQASSNSSSPSKSQSNHAAAMDWQAGSSLGSAASAMQQGPSSASAGNSSFNAHEITPVAVNKAASPVINTAHHPKGKAATGGQSHSHRPVSAMPAPIKSSSSSGAGATSSNGNHSGNPAASFANIVNNQPYNDRRNSAHPVLSNPSSSSSAATGSIKQSMTPLQGMDPQTANAIISHGIPITSPAALQYFSAHPRRQQVHFGNYLLLQTLGEGEFGKVKLGVHKEWGEEVAVKLIKRDRVASNGGADTSTTAAGEKDPSKMSKVEREIQVLKEVRHPNIVRLYEVIESDRYIGIVLEYASGGELFDHILAHKYLRERDACRLFAQLISGVHYLHQKRIIHRDLKLENLLLDRNRNVIITDFGFANNFGDKRDDLMATSCGSPCYAAPELVVQDGLYAGSAVDVWSCGVILYAMLAGYLPFDDDPANPDGDNINLLYKYIMATPLSFPDYIPAEPRDLLSKMLVPDPLKRADLNVVMNHSWLAAYRDLFKFSLEDLERAAIEQQTKKRQVYRQQMLYQQQIREQQKQQGSMPTSGSKQGGAAVSRSESVRDAVKPQRHQSATPTAISTSATSPSVLSDGQSTPRASRAPSSGSSARTAGATQAFDHVAAQGDARGEPRSRITLENDQAALSPVQVNLPTPRTPAEAEMLPRKPAAQKTQRHTIQLEYTGEPKQKRERELPPPSPADETIAEKVGASPAALASTKAAFGASPAKAKEAATPAAAPISIPAFAAVVPLAEKITTSATAGAIASPESQVPSPVAKDEAAAADTSVSAPPQKRRPATATPTPIADRPTTGVTVPFPDVDAQRRNSRIASDNVRRGAKTSTNGRAPGPPVAASAVAASELERANSRHRKGMSRDNSFFSRLLSSNSQAVDVNAALGADGASSNEMRRTSSNSGSASGKSTGRRKTMSLVVSNLASGASKDRQAANNADSKSERRLTGRLRSKETVTEDASSKRQSVTPRTKQAPQQIATGDSGVYKSEDASTMGSTNAAKKVMDWFRKKSLAKGNFDEQPPLAFERPSEEKSAGPRVVVTGAAPNGQTAPVAAAHTESSGPSSRSTSGTHSYTSNDTQASVDTANTTVTQSSVSSAQAPVKSTSTVQVDTTPRGSVSAVNGAGLARANKPFDDKNLRQHVGALDQTALTSLPPPDALIRVREALTTMGIDFRLASGEDFKLECLRPKRESKGFTAAAQGLGSTIRTSVFRPSQAEIERSGQASIGSPSSPNLPSGGSIRNFLRRGSSQQGGIPQSTTAASMSGAPLPTLYGDNNIDNGQEVRFSVEITKIANLPGLYSLDVRRMRGNVWAFKFCYTALLQRCNLSGQGIAL